MRIDARLAISASFLVATGTGTPALALDGGTLRLNTFNGWKAFEVISQAENPTGDGHNYAMPSTYDGIGALIAGSSFRVQVNHERSSGNANVSEVLLNLNNFKTAITNVMNSGNTGGISFVTSAKQAYDRWSNDGGATWIATSSSANTSFNRFCSSQSYAPNTFGPGRGFVDDVYITGEEVGGGRLFALDINSNDFYRLSGVIGSGPGGLGGMPADAWENVALIDTGETDHVALLLSPDGGTTQMKIYIGEKGKDASGNASNSFLARNGLAYGSYYYLNDTLPTTIGTTSIDGFFDTTAAGSLASSKLEDVDTNPSAPTKVVLGDQNSGTYTFDFSLDFSGGSFNAGGSSFSLTMIDGQGGGDGVLEDADNVDWAGATTLNGTNYPDGLIFVNEDNSSGEIWMMNPDGSDQTRIASTTVGAESSGILDVSELLGYNPGSILLTANQGSPSSMSVLINPDATPIPEPASFVLLGLGGLLVSRRRR